MGVQFNLSSAAMLLFMVQVVCCQQHQKNIVLQCSESSTSLNDCSYEKTNLKRYFNSSSAKPTFWCPEGYELMHARGIWLHACQPKSCPGKSLETPLKCVSFSRNLKNCPKIYLENNKYTIDTKGNLNVNNDDVSVPLGDYYIDSTERVVICDSNNNKFVSNPRTESKLPRWCTPFEVPKGGYSKRGRRLFVNQLNVEVDIFIADIGDTAYVCPEIDPKVYETCGNYTGLLPSNEVQVLDNWTIRDTKPVLEKYLYHRDEYILAENISFVIVCAAPEEPNSGAATYKHLTVHVLSIFVHLFLAVFIV